jgi:PAS domain S-box-containing protein
MVSVGEKTKEQLTEELAVLRLRVTELEALGAEREKLEKELQKIEQRYSTIADAARDVIILIDSKANIVSCNKALHTTFGYTKEEILNKHLTILMPEQFRTAFQMGFERLDSKGMLSLSEITHEFPGLRKDGSQFAAEISIGCWKQDEEVFYVGIVRDITESERAEEALRLSEEKFRTQYRNIPIPTYTWQRTGDDFVLIDYNYAASTITQGRIPEFVGKTASEMYGDSPEILEEFRRCFTGKTPIKREMAYRFKSTGESKYFNVSYAFVPPDLVMVHTEEITNRKRVEEALRKLEQEKAAILDNMCELVIFQDMEHRVTWGNKVAVESVNQTPEQLVGCHCYEIWQQRSQPCAGCTVAKAREKGQPQTGEITGPDGRAWFISASPVRNGDGDMVGIVEIVLDITERKRAEEKLQTILKTALDGFWLINKEGKLLEVNDSYCKMIGYTREELLKMSIPDIEAVESPGEVAQRIKRITEQGHDRFESRHKCKDGKIIDVEVSVNYLDVGEGQLFVFARDITKRKRAEEALRESEEKYRSLINNVKLGVFRSTPEPAGRFLEVNPAMEEITGYSRKELLQMNVTGLYVNPEERESVLEEVASATGKVTNELCFRKKDGTEITILDRKVAVRDETGQILYFDGIVEDITRRKQAEAALRESERKYKDLAESITDVFFAFDKDLRYTYWNRASEELTGISAKDALGKNIYDIFPDTEMTRKAEKAYLKALKTKQPQYFINEYQLGDKEFLFEISAYPSTSGLSVFVKDITERKQAEEALRESEEFSSSLLNSSPIPIIVVNPDTSVRYVNPALEKLTGFTSAEIIGRKAPYPWWTEETLQKTSGDLAIAMRKGAKRIEELFQKKNGERFWVEITSGPIMHNGEFKYYLANWVDITQSKQAEEALRESEEKHRSLINNVKSGVFRGTPEPSGKFLEVNPAMEEITGYSREELLQMNVADLYVNPEERESVLEEVASATGKVTNELRFRKEDGTEIMISDTKVAVRDETGQILYFDGIVEDITERKRAEEALRREKERTEQYFNIAGVMLAILDADERITLINKKGCEILGYEEEELIGKNWYDTLVPEETREKRRRNHHGLMAGDIKPVKYWERPLLTKDGEKRLIGFYVTVVRDPSGQPIGVLLSGEDVTERKWAEEALQESEAQKRAILDGSPDGIRQVDTNLRILWANQASLLRNPDAIGQTCHKAFVYRDKPCVGCPSMKAIETGQIERGIMYQPFVIGVRGEYYCEHIGVPIKENGKVVGVIQIVRDVTERKLAEEREKQLQQELYHSSRLAAIGELAAGVAHELNNPLTGIVGFSERMARKCTAEEASKDLTRINSEAMRAAKVVQNLLTFARRREPKKQYVDINEIVQKALELRAYELKTSNIEVKLSLNPDLPVTLADFHQIQEVFLNIILNAEQTLTETKGGGRLSIKTRRVNAGARISFTDDGPGIPAENLDRLFDPFFTTRGDRGGTGLGLSVCHGIVAEHGGKIYAKSKPGKGSVFFIELPLTTESANGS